MTDRYKLYEKIKKYTKDISDNECVNMNKKLKEFIIQH